MYDDVQSDTAHALKFLVQTQAYEAALLQVRDLLFPEAFHYIPHTFLRIYVSLYRGSGQQFK